jgi:hypothetical protein
MVRSDAEQPLHTRIAVVHLISLQSLASLSEFTLLDELHKAFCADSFGHCFGHSFLDKVADQGVDGGASFLRGDSRFAQQRFVKSEGDSGLHAARLIEREIGEMKIRQDSKFESEVFSAL